MNQLFSHGEKRPSKAPPQRTLPIIERMVAVYKMWYGYRDHFPKKSRYTLGDKIDNVFIKILECLCIASYQKSEQKIGTIAVAINQLDILKFFIRLAWELAILDNKKFIALSEELHEIGKMLGDWKRGLESKTPAR